MSKMRKVQAQRKFAQGAYIPPHASNNNNNTLERRGDGQFKPAAPPILLQNISAFQLLDQVSFQSIHLHAKKLTPVVRLERLPSPTPKRLKRLQRPAPTQPRVRFAGTSSRYSVPLAFRTRNKPKQRAPRPAPKPVVHLRRLKLPPPRPDSPAPNISASEPPAFRTRAHPPPQAHRTLKKGLKQSRSASPKKKKKMVKRLRVSRRLRQRQATRSAKEDTDTEDDTPLTLLAKSKASLPKPVPPKPVPQKTVLQKTVPQKTVAQKTVPQKTVLQKTVLQKTVPQKTVPQKTAHQKTVPNKAVLAKTATPKTATEPSTMARPPAASQSRTRPKSPAPEPSVTPSSALVQTRTRSKSPVTDQPPAKCAKTHHRPEAREGFYSPQNIERWITAAEQATATRCPPEPTFKVPLPPKDRRPLPYPKVASIDIISNKAIAFSDDASWISTTCPSERYLTVRDVVSASSKERGLRCQHCNFCLRADKVEKLTKVVQANSEGRDDVYEFDAERDGADASGSDLLRRFRDRRAADTRDIYLDLLPRSDRILILTNAGNHSKGLMQIKLIKKSDAKTLCDDNLIKNESLLDQLIETMDSLPTLESFGQSRQPTPPSSVDTNEDREEREPPTEPERKSPKPKRNVVSKSKQLPNRTWKTVKTLPLHKAGPSGSRRVAQPRSVPAKPPAPRPADWAADSAVMAAEAASSPVPLKDTTAVVRDAPVYYPTENEFNDPVAYFEKIMPEASKFGICKVVAPPSFKPRCTLYEKIRFNVANQYVARLYIRWGQASKEMCAIKAYLASQSVSFTRAPLLDSLEVDLPRLYRTVQRLGGLKMVIEKKRWGRVAEEMRFGKGAKLEKKLDDIYVRYLLPYDTLSTEEREAIKTAVNKAWHVKNGKIAERAMNPLHRQRQLLGDCPSSSDTEDENDDIANALTEAEDCIVTGRRMTLPNFTKVAQAMRDIYFPNNSEPTPQQVEDVYWKIVLLADEHICVNTASIDTGDEGFGFPKNKQEPYGRHPWNLKMISQNAGNVLHLLGSVLGVTVPTLHLGMIFSTSCWHRDPHGLPWMEYMHSGPAKIWYGIPDEQSAAFRRAVETLCPAVCQNKSIWLPSDITMIPPASLLASNVSLTRVEQKPGEYIIVFPKAYSSSICTGYTQSESVYFATKSWLTSVDQVFQELRDSCEPTMFSLEQLLIAVARDLRAPPSLLQLVHATLAGIVADERYHRRELSRRGVPVTTSARPLPSKKPAGAWNVREQDECEVCRTTLYLSKVTGLTEKNSAVCPSHALLILATKCGSPRDLSQVSLTVFFTIDQLNEVMAKLQSGFAR